MQGSGGPAELEAAWGGDEGGGTCRCAGRAHTLVSPCSCTQCNRWRPRVAVAAPTTRHARLHRARRHAHVPTHANREPRHGAASNRAAVRMALPLQQAGGWLDGQARPPCAVRPSQRDAHLAQRRRAAARPKRRPSGAARVACGAPWRTVGQSTGKPAVRWRCFGARGARGCLGGVA